MVQDDYGGDTRGCCRTPSLGPPRGQHASPVSTLAVPEPGAGALQGSGLAVFRAAWLGLSPFPGEREMKTDHVLGVAGRGRGGPCLEA